VSAETELQQLLDGLIHCYNDTPGGNFARLFWPLAKEMAEMREILETIRDSRYLESAEGYSLDLIGSGISLGRDDDESDFAYRKRLQLELLILCSQGTLEEIRTIISEALNIESGHIKIYNNAAPSEDLTDIPYFVEISVHERHYPKAEFAHGFKFSDNATESTFNSPLGFDMGVGMWSKEPAAILTELEELLERILPTGVQYQLAVHGGFKFSDNATVSTFDSLQGFDNGAWRGAIA